MRPATGSTTGQTCYTTKTRLWPSVIRELILFRSLMPLAIVDTFLPWPDKALCVDACLSGYAVMEGDIDSAVISTAGRVDERWRFKRAFCSHDRSPIAGFGRLP